MITAGWAFAVLIGVFTAQAFGERAARTSTPQSPLACWPLALFRQGMLCFISSVNLLGRSIGAVIVWLAYMDHFAATTGEGSQGGKLAVFSTGPAIRNTVPNLITEIIGTFVLVMGVGAIFQINTPVAGIQVAGGLYPAACPVWGIGLSLGGPTGYALNPARDLGPRIMHFVLPIPGKGDSDWGYSWIPVVGPIMVASSPPSFTMA